MPSSIPGSITNIHVNMLYFVYEYVNVVVSPDVEGANANPKICVGYYALSVTQNAVHFE